MINPNYKKPKTGAGELRTPVSFYVMETGTGPEPNEGEETILHQSMCEAYNPSIKDLSILDTTGTKKAVTIRIRDPGSEYQPTNKHLVKLNDYRYTDQVFSVIDVRPDLKENRFITLLLGVIS